MKKTKKIMPAMLAAVIVFLLFSGVKTVIVKADTAKEKIEVSPVSGTEGEADISISDGKVMVTNNNAAESNTGDMSAVRMVLFLILCVISCVAIVVMLLKKKYLYRFLG
jgi:hypothetical protein